MKGLLASSLGSSEEFIFLFVQNRRCWFLDDRAQESTLRPQRLHTGPCTGDPPTWSLRSPASKECAIEMGLTYHRSGRACHTPSLAAIHSPLTHTPGQGLRPQEMGSRSHPRVRLPHLLVSLHLVESYTPGSMCHLPQTEMKIAGTLVRLWRTSAACLNPWEKTSDLI